MNIIVEMVQCLQLNIMSFHMALMVFGAGLILVAAILAYKNAPVRVHTTVAVAGAVLATVGTYQAWPF